MFARFRPLAVASLAACLMLLGCSANSEQSSAKNGVLWKIEKSGSQPSWLFATTYVTNPQLAQFPAHVETALSQASHVGTEIKIDFGSMMAMGKAMLTPEPSLADKIGAEQYAKLLPELAAREYPEVAAAKFQPWAAAMLLTAPVKGKGLIPMDMLIMKHAMENEKDYFGLESVDERLKPFQSLSDAQQLSLLNALIGQEEKVAPHYQAVSEMYLKQNLDGIRTLAEQDNIKLPEADQAWFKEWKKQLIEQRNVTMAKRIQEHLTEGNAFVAVDAVQLAGKTGLIERLREAGYTVTPVLK